MEAEVTIEDPGLLFYQRVVNRRAGRPCCFWPDDEESACLCQAIETCKIEEPTIHDREATGLRRHQIEHVHFMHFTVRNMDKRRNVSTQIDLRVHLHSSFGGTKVSPRKHAK